MSSRFRAVVSSQECSCSGRFHTSEFSFRAFDSFRGRRFRSRGFEATVGFGFESEDSNHWTLQRDLYNSLGVAGWGFAGGKSRALGLIRIANGGCCHPTGPKHLKSRNYCPVAYSAVKWRGTSRMRLSPMQNLFKRDGLGCCSHEIPGYVALITTVYFILVKHTACRPKALWFTQTCKLPQDSAKRRRP